METLFANDDTTFTDSNGKTYKPVVARVVESDDQGKPILLRVYSPKDVIELSEDPEANQFAVMLGSTDMF